MRTKVTGLYQDVSLVTAAGFGDLFEFRPRSAAEQRRTAALSRSYRRADGHVLR